MSKQRKTGFLFRLTQRLGAAIKAALQSATGKTSDSAATVPGPEYFVEGVYPQHPDLAKYDAGIPVVNSNGYGDWGKGFDVCKLVCMITDQNAPWMNGKNRSAARVEQIIRYLNPGGPKDPDAPKSMRYSAPTDPTCNGFAKDAMWLMNAPLPYHAPPEEDNSANRSASYQHDWLIEHSVEFSPEGKSCGWHKTTFQKAQEYANEGYPALQSNQQHIAVIIRDPEAGQEIVRTFVAEGNKKEYVSNGKYTDPMGYDHFVYIYE